MAQMHSSQLPFILFQGLNSTHKRTALLNHFLSLVTKWGLAKEYGSKGWWFFQKVSALWWGMIEEVINLMRPWGSISWINFDFILHGVFLFLSSFFVLLWVFFPFLHVVTFQCTLQIFSHSTAGKQYKHFLSQEYLLLYLINMHVFGTQLGSAGMLSSISFFIYMRLGGVTYGASWLSWIGIFIKPCELCIWLLIVLWSTLDTARTLSYFLLGGMFRYWVTKRMHSTLSGKKASLLCISSTECFANLGERNSYWWHFYPTKLTTVHAMCVLPAPTSYSSYNEVSYVQNIRHNNGIPFKETSILVP